MAGDDQSDPFFWDESRVVQELCTPTRSWTAPPANKLPDPATLEARLRECGVEGDALLTYADEFSFELLWKYLGISKFSHQLSLKEAISQFRKRSPRYREWKRAKQLVDRDEEDSRLPTGAEPHKQTGLGLNPHLDAASGASLGNGPAVGNAVGPKPALLELAIPSQGVLSPALSPSAESNVLMPPEAPDARELNQLAAEEPSTKKRRIAPTTIPTDRTNRAFATIPTEGDAFLTGPAENLLHASDSSGFLGSGTLSLERILQPETTDMEVNERVFLWTGKAIPPGRRIQVAGAVKRFLRSSRPDTATPNIDREGLDSVLPLFGESDDDESLDSETWREYEEEEQERLAKEARMEADQERMLPKEKVIEAVNTAIQDLEVQWVAEKKPKHDRKAWKLWQDARRSPNRLALVHSARKRRDDADLRIARFAEHIIAQPWSNDREVRQKATGFLEESVSEKKYQDWRIDVLESPRQPPKPSALPRPTPKPKRELILDDDEEVLTSDSDDMDDFIEYDDNVATFPRDEMDIDWDQPPAQPTTPFSPVPDMQVDSKLPQSPTASPEDEGDNDLPPMRHTPKIKSEKTLVPATLCRSVLPDHEVIMIDSSPSPIETTDEVPDFDCPEGIEKIERVGIQHWQSVEDAERLVVAIVCGWSREKIARIAKVINNRDHSEVWDKYILPSIEDHKVAEQGSVELDLALLFDAFISKSAQRLRRSFLRPLTTIRFKREQALFGPFCAHLKRIVRHILPDAISETSGLIPPRTPSKQAPSQQAAETHNPINDPSHSSDGSSEEMSIPPPMKRQQVRKRRDKAAEDLRLKNVKVNQEHERRARQLREEIAESGSVPGDKSRLIVNETKESHESLIYFNGRIGNQIKDHQIEGVRFMWNQVVVDSNVRQGCLLAHTMGLGKTMQVIALLVVIAEASASPDESVRSQIPESLRQSKTLILCPPGLVDNWSDEISTWAPDGALGPVRRVDTTLAKDGRLASMREWASGGGVLIIGYALFTQLVQSDEEIAKLLWETPNIVVGDEAHQLKNPDSQRHQASANFRTMNRIAMTGSPLTNNVMDYYSMINWVAPGYLADIAEFRERYGNPIKEGLYADSDAYQKRRARKLLKVLNETVGPKVHRKDIQVLFQELPTKKEFIITLPLTDLQKRLYETYIEWARSPVARAQVTGQARVWSLVFTLALVLAHPIIFKTVAEAKKEPSKQPKKKAVEGGEGDEDEIEVPQDVLHDLLAKVAVRNIEDYALSNKLVVLLRILEECRKVGDKVLVFSQSIPTLNYLENIFKRRRVVYQRLDGKTPVTARQSSIRKFNTDAESQVYLISTRAGGLGLNIYGANRVVIFDFGYTPAEEQQAIGRAYRLGQTKPVYVYWLTVGGTFEDTIHNNAIFKTQLASRVVDKKNPDPWSKRFAEYFTMPRTPDPEDLSKAFGQDQVLDALLKDHDISRLVRKITSTETFEKEETYELSAEDQQDVEKMLELQRLRQENPEEYRRREHEITWQSIERGIAPPPLSSYQPLSADSKSKAITECTGDRSNRIVMIKVPEHMGEKRSGLAAPSVGSRVTSESLARDTLPSLSPADDEPSQKRALTLTTDPARVTDPRLPHLHLSTNSTAPAPTQRLAIGGNTEMGKAITPPPASSLNGISVQESRTANLQPILATGTQYKTPDLPPSSASLGKPSPAGSSPIVPSILSAPSKASFSATALDQDFTALFDVHSKLHREGQHVRYRPDELVNMVKNVLVQRRVEGLPLMDKMQNLQKSSRDPRFAEAMLAGHIKPEQLASMTRPEMDALSTSLNGLSDAQFKQRVRTSKADLNVCTGTHKRLATFRQFPAFD
ncbi:Protein CHROMATIN REMODELING 20 [Madurella mycetomatis]|uniref:Protein CHROMATIN REMODELING 20 n=1 Tax=Madurella mycetomatis TaxID=100816 RepID=A0A175VSV3_9PEZI|nr:Protein CHROMATIN REMODELING 20 [Madurella mycetomatis]